MDRFGDGEEVCHRANCRAKKEDLARHTVFREQARRRNSDERCWLPECDEWQAMRCERCGPSYCVVHVQDVVVTALYQGERGADVVRLCLHCVSRVELWERE